MTVKAIFEGGVFRPLTAVDLPEHSKVEVDFRPIDSTAEGPQEELYRLLGESFDGGPPDLAARVDEHQP
jgi:predicted DNA-binding antitoxin AbrB/MazE fold protein